ncbi:hypothetical protein YB2330_006482 [Saitoella coloradoensis]
MSSPPAEQKSPPRRRFSLKPGGSSKSEIPSSPTRADADESHDQFAPLQQTISGGVSEQEVSRLKEMYVDKAYTEVKNKLPKHRVEEPKIAFPMSMAFGSFKDNQAAKHENPKSAIDAQKAINNPPEPPVSVLVTVDKNGYVKNITKAMPDRRASVAGSETSDGGKGGGILGGFFRRGSGSK